MCKRRKITIKIHSWTNDALIEDKEKMGKKEVNEGSLSVAVGGRYSRDCAFERKCSGSYRRVWEDGGPKVSANTLGKRRKRVEFQQRREIP